MPHQRRYTVHVSPTEAARLRTFDNEAEGRQPWPLGPKRTFRRTRRGTFVVQEHAGAAWDAILMTAGTARLGADDTVDIRIGPRSVWLGWLFVACGLVIWGRLLSVEPTVGETLRVAGVSALLVAAGWVLFIRRPGVGDDLDEIEEVMREEIRGDWRRAE